MSKSTLAQLPAKLYELLEPFEPQERQKAIQATLVLFGDEQPSAGPAIPTLPIQPQSGRQLPNSTDPSAYFDEKEPKNKGEALAVAARYRELNEAEETHSKADLKKVTTDARRNFDDSNFARDINNAKRQAGFFNLGTSRDANKLSYFGQQYVDALPDREAAAKLKRPKIGGNKKKSTKRQGKKKKT